MAETSQEAIGTGLGEGLNTIAAQLRFNQAQRVSQRDQQADQIASQMKEVAQNIVRVGGRDKPEAQPLINQLNELSRQHNSLYPPHETPALLERLRTLTGHARSTPQLDPRANASTDTAIAAAKLPEYDTTEAGQMDKSRIAGNIAIRNNDVTQNIQQANKVAAIDWAKRNNVSDEALADLTATLAGVPASLLKPPADKSGQWEDLYGMIDGKRVTLHHSRATNETTDFQGNPMDPEVMKRFVADEKFAPVKNKQAWIIRDGKPLSVMLDSNNHPMPGTENPDAVPPPALFGRITTTDYITDDGFGNIVSIPKTTVSGPIGGPLGGGTVATPPARPAAAAPAPATPAPAAPGPGGTPAPAAGPGLPKSPAEARAMLPPPAPRPAGPTIVGSKATASEKSAQTDYDKAVGMSKLADEASAHPSALTDKNLAISLARFASGRFSIAEYDTMIKNAGLGNTFDQWMNNVQSGQLTDDIRKQLVNVAKQNLIASKAALDSSHGAHGQPKPGGNSVDDQILQKLDQIQSKVH